MSEVYVGQNEQHIVVVIRLTWLKPQSNVKNKVYQAWQIWIWVYHGHGEQKLPILTKDWLSQKKITVNIKGQYLLICISVNSLKKYIELM